MPAERPGRNHKTAGETAGKRSPFSIRACHAIMLVNAETVKECGKMNEKKKAMARIVALVIAGIMTLSVILAVLLK